MEIFQFKQFQIKQNAASVFKVNTEAVLLTAWVTITPNIEILEIGSGSGVISLGLIQRIDKSSHIRTIDIDKNAYDLTLENIAINKAAQVSALNISLQDFNIQNPTKTFDLIISNPPYFQTKWKSTKPRNILSKYTDTLDYETLLEIGLSRLKENGVLAIIIPFNDLNIIKGIALKNQSFISRIMTLKTIFNKSPLRVLLEIKKGHSHMEYEAEEITIKGENGLFSEEYKNMTKDYYKIF